MPSAYLDDTPGVESDKNTFMNARTHTRRATNNDCGSEWKLTPPEYEINFRKEFRLFGRVSAKITVVQRKRRVRVEKLKF